MASIMSFGAGSGLSSCASLDTVSKKEPIIVPSVKELTIPSNYISHCIDEKDYCISVPGDWLILDSKKMADSINKAKVGDQDLLAIPDYMKEFIALPMNVSKIAGRSCRKFKNSHQLRQFRHLLFMIIFLHLSSP